MPIHASTVWEFTCSICGHVATGAGSSLVDALPEGSMRITGETHGTRRQQFWWLCASCTPSFFAFIKGIGEVIDITGPPINPPDVTPEVTSPVPQVFYEVQQDWGTGHIAKAIIRTQNEGIPNGWQVEFDTGDTTVITNVWDGVLISSDTKNKKTHWVLGNADYNDVIDPSASTAVNWQADGPTGVSSLIVKVL